MNEETAAKKLADVPDELRLPEWLGPSLFTKEKLVRSTDPRSPVERMGDHAGLVVGSVREKNGHVWSAFVVRDDNDEVWLLDANDAKEDRYVNASLDVFLASIEAFHTAWPHLVDETPEREKLVARFRALLDKLDPRALANAEHYWPAWLGELCD